MYANEMPALGNKNMKTWYILEWLSKHDELQKGTQAELITLYIDDILVAYGLLENFEAVLIKPSIMAMILIRT